MEMDEMDKDGLHNAHRVNLGRLRTKLAKTTSEFVIKQWELAVEGITSLESSS